MACAVLRPFSSPSRCWSRSPEWPRRPPPGQAGHIRHRATIDATGRQDVTVPLVAFIRSVPDGSTVTFPRGARYRIESTVAIESPQEPGHRRGRRASSSPRRTGRRPRRSDRRGCTWQVAAAPGPVRRLQQRPRHAAEPRPCAARTRAPGLGDDAFVLKRSRPRPASSSIGSINSLLENCSISYTYGDFVYIGMGSTGTVVQRMHHDAQRPPGDHGLRRGERDRSTATTSRTCAAPRSTSSRTSPGGRSQNVWITNNTFGPTRLLHPGAKGATGDVNDIVFANNRLVGEPMTHQRTPRSTASSARLVRDRQPQ